MYSERAVYILTSSQPISIYGSGSIKPYCYISSPHITQNWIEQLLSTEMSTCAMTTRVEYISFFFILLAVFVIIPPASSVLSDIDDLCPQEIRNASHVFPLRDRSGTYLEIYSIGAAGLLSVAWKSSRKISIIRWPERNLYTNSEARFVKENVTKSGDILLRDPTVYYSDFLVAEWNGTLNSTVVTVSETTRYPWKLSETTSSTAVSWRNSLQDMHEGGREAWRERNRDDTRLLP